MTQPALTTVGSAPALAIVVIALLGHAVTLASQRAINLDGSQSALVPATGERLALDLTAYYASGALLIASYVLLLMFCLRGRIRGLGRAVVLLAPVALQLVLLIPRPFLSTDVLSYLAQGSLGSLTGIGNAYTALPRDVLGTPIGDQLAALGWRPQTILSPYGPLWTAYETFVARATRDVAAGIILLKVVPLAANLASALLIWRILGLVRPGLRLVGTVAFLWNPAVIVEVAAEGHVEGLMTCLALLGIYGALRLQPSRAMVAGGLAVVTKYIPAVLLPAQLVFLWRTSRRAGQTPRSLALGVVAGTGVALLAFVPFWAGTRTFEGLREMGQPGPWPTVTGMIYRYLERAYPGIDGGAIATLVVGGAFAAYLLHAGLEVRDPVSLLASSARTSLAFVLFAAPVFFPWYVVLPVALIALVPETAYLLVAVAITTLSRIVAPLVDLRPAYEPFPAAAYTLTSLGLLLCIALVGAIGVSAVWAWARAKESTATA